MKKILTLLLTICLVSLLAACASQRELDAIAAEQAALQVKYDALQSEYEALQKAPYSDFIEWIECESYPAAIEFVKKRQAAEAFAEKGPIEDYLVTVELTTENFSDYFEWKSFPSLDAFGEETDYWDMVLTSKVYQEGLVFYQSDAKYEKDGSGYEYELHLGCTGQTRDLERWKAEKVDHVSGSVTFVKSDYVMEYTIYKDDPTFHRYCPDNPFRDANVALVNGENIFRSILPGYEY